MPVPMDTTHVSNSYCEDVPSQTTEEQAEEDELWVVKGKATEFKGQCSHCHQYGHRLSEGLQKERELGKTIGGELGFDDSAGAGRD